MKYGSEIKNDSLYHYSSSTQRNYKELGERSGDSKWIHENIEHLIDNIDDVLLDDEIEMKKLLLRKKLQSNESYFCKLDFTLFS